MLIRLLAAFALCAAPLAATAQDKKPADDKKPAAGEKPAADENPYKNVKVGDFATYKMNVKAGPLALTGTTTQTITAKTDKEATVEVTANVSGMDVPAQKQVIDLTKPYDPTQVGGGLPAGTDATVEKGKDGKEKIKVGGKEYDTTWTTYKVKATAGGQKFDADVKVWTAKDVPMGTVKMEMTANIADMKMEMTMELSETGNKKK
jgi:hypothetical protein